MVVAFFNHAFHEQPQQQQQQQQQQQCPDQHVYPVWPMALLHPATRSWAMLGCLRNPSPRVVILLGAQLAHVSRASSGAPLLACSIKMRLNLSKTGHPN